MAVRALKLLTLSCNGAISLRNFDRVLIRTAVEQGRLAKQFKGFV